MDPTADWRALLSEDPDIEELEELTELHSQRQDAILGAPLYALSDAIFSALLITEDRMLRERLLPPLTPMLQRALPATEEDSLIDGLGLVSCATLLAAAGAAGDLDPGSVLERWIPAAVDAEVDVSDGYRTSCALACAAHGFDNALFELVGEPPMPFVPGASFGPDARSFARYVAAAAAERATVDEIKTAWTSFVAFLPTRLQTGGLRWTDLLFAGYAAYVRIAGFAPDEVLDLIREFVREMAAA